jgi:hypothetical protein
MLEGLIVLVCRDRPDLAIRAAKSVTDNSQHFGDWKLAIVQTRSGRAAEIVQTALSGHLHKVCVYDVGLDDDAVGGLLGMALNRAISQSNADFVIVLKETDRLHPRYLYNIEISFQICPSVDVYYSLTVPTRAGEIVQKPAELNEHEWTHGGIASQKKSTQRFLPILDPNSLSFQDIAWRTRLQKERGLWFPEPDVLPPDQAFLERLVPEHASAIFSSNIGQICSRASREEIDRLLDMAFRLYKQSRHTEAEAVYRDVTASAPLCGVARHMLRVIASDRLRAAVR